MEKILYSVSSGGIRVAVQLPDDAGSGCGRITFYNTSNGQRLFVTNGLNLLCPVVDGERLRPALQSIRQQEGLLELVFSGGGLTELVLTLDGRGEALLLSSSFLTSGTELNALEILPSGSMVNFYDLINFRNHHGTPSTWPELPLADKVDTTTFSSDWQFAPHPSMPCSAKTRRWYWLRRWICPRPLASASAVPAICWSSGIWTTAPLATGSR